MPADLSTGADAIGGERFGDCEYNDLKNHWRMAGVCQSGGLSDPQPGMIVSDETDDRLYHVILASGCDCSEILQDCVPLSDDKYWGVGDDWDGMTGYDELTNDAWMFGIPVSPKRGVIVCDIADIAVDFTGIITASAYPVFWFIDLDNDSYLGVGHQADDRPGIWSGAADTSILAIQYDANADITIFENSEIGENRLVYLYGWDAGAAATRYGSQQITNSGSYELNAEEQGALAQGGTVVVRWFSDRVQWLDNKLAEFGSSNDASIEYCEALNDAWIFGIPCNAAKRGLIFCDNPAADMTFLPFRTLPTLTGPDPDLDSYWELGWFADDVGLLTIPANPLREQILMNSQFGVWSQSDANKGIAALVFDNGTVAPVVGEAIVGGLATGKVMWVNVTNNDWAGGNGAGTCYLGATSGAYIDNETIAGSVAASFDVNGDLNIGVKNDPMNDNSVASWTDDGAGIVLAFVAAEYSVTTTAINQRAWIINAGLTAGKIYKIELDIKDGTQAGVDIEGYLNDGVAQYGKIETTAAGWASVAWVFECATTTAVGLVGFRIPANLGGNNIQVRNFSCYEITPGCTATDSKAFDGGWTKDASLDLYRQHNDGGTYTKDGSFYSLKCVPSTASVYLTWNYNIRNNAEYFQQYAGKTVAFGCWVKTSVANHFRLNLYDGALVYSPYHTGGGTWEWIEVTDTINAAVTEFQVRMHFAQAGDIDGTTIVYVSQPMLSFGASLGEGNYRPRQQEFIWVEAYIASNELDGLLNQSDSAAFVGLNVEADSDAMLPKGCKAISALSTIKDSGSLGDENIFVVLQSDSLRAGQTFNDAGGTPNNFHHYCQSGWQACDEDGDVDYRLYASGANTLDIVQFRYLGVQIN